MKYTHFKIIPGTSGPKEKEYIHTGYEFAPQLAQGYVTAGGRTATDIHFFIVAMKTPCIYVEDA